MSQAEGKTCSEENMVSDQGRGSGEGVKPSCSVNEGNTGKCTTCRGGIG